MTALTDIQSDEPDARRIAQAILRTVLYADVFDFPLTAAEIHHFLINCPISLGTVQASLSNSAYLAEYLEVDGEYYALRGRGTLIAERRTRDAASAQLWRLARRYGHVLAHLPFVRMVAITGSLAMRNAKSDKDDIDYFVVTLPGRVWLTRLMIVAVVKFAKWRGAWLCPNFVVAKTALSMDRHDLYMAHEITQAIPLAGWDIYRALREANAWVAALLPNATQPFYREADLRPQGVGRALQYLGECFLRGPLGAFLESWEQRRKQRKFAQQIRDSQSAAQLDDQQIKGHFKDHGYPSIQKYEARLRAYQLEGAEMGIDTGTLQSAAHSAVAGGK